MTARRDRPGVMACSRPTSISAANEAPSTQSVHFRSMGMPSACCTPPTARGTARIVGPPSDASPSTFTPRFACSLRFWSAESSRRASDAFARDLRQAPDRLIRLGAEPAVDRDPERLLDLAHPVGGRLDLRRRVRLGPEREVRGVRHRTPHAVGDLTERGLDLLHRRLGRLRGTDPSQRGLGLRTPRTVGDRADRLLQPCDHDRQADACHGAVRDLHVLRERLPHVGARAVVRVGRDRQTVGGGNRRQP